jgi:hypothetical protein
MNETLQEYKKWLKWFLANGGRATHYYDYSFNNQDFIVAKQNGKYLGGFGSQSINLVVPEHVTNFTIDDIGHSNIYQYDMKKMKNVTFIPQFEDVCLDYESQVKEMLRKKEWEEYKQEMERKHQERKELLQQYDNGINHIEKRIERGLKERKERMEERRAEYEAQSEGMMRTLEYNNKKADEVLRGFFIVIGLIAILTLLIHLFIK